MIRPFRLLAWLAALSMSWVTPASAIEGSVNGDWPFAVAAERAHAAALAIQDHVEPPLLTLLKPFGPRVEVRVHQWLGQAYLALDALAPARRHWQRVEKLAARCGQSGRYANALARVGDLQLQAGQGQAALQSASRLLELARLRRDPGVEAEALRQLGVVHRRSGQLDEALTHMQHALELSRDADKPILIAHVLNSLGSLYRDRGDFAKALESHLEALDIRLRNGDRVDTSYRNIALLYREIDDDATVVDYLERALAVARQRGNPLAFSPILGSYSVVFNDLGQHERALQAAGQALVIDRLSGNRSATGFDEIEIGRAYIGMGHIDDGLASLQRALATGRELGLHEIIARSLLPMAEQALLRKDIAATQALLEEATAVVERSQLRPQLSQAYALHERLALLRNDYPTALRFAHLYGNERDLLVGTRASRQLTELKVRNARVDSEHLLTLLQKDNELQAIRLRAQGLEKRLSLMASVALALLAALAFWRHAGTRRLNRDLRQKNAEIEAQRAALSEVNQRLQHQANELYAASIRDGLTGAFNRGYLIHQLGDAVRNALQQGTDVSLLMVDFDHFKAINDSRGHLYGDAVLVTAVQAMAEALGPSDLLARFGGEEFVVMLDGQDSAAATVTAELLRKRVEQALQRFDATGRASTISIGVAALSTLAKPTMDNLIDTADRAVYRAKALGRNRVVVADPSMQDAD